MLVLPVPPLPEATARIMIGLHLDSHEGHAGPPFLVDLILPAVVQGVDSIEFRAVGLDVEQRRAVEDVYSVQVKHIAFASNQFVAKLGDGVGTARASGREDAALDVLQKP